MLASRWADSTPDSEPEVPVRTEVSLVESLPTTNGGLEASIYATPEINRKSDNQGSDGSSQPSKLTVSQSRPQISRGLSASKYATPAEKESADTLQHSGPLVDVSDNAPTEAKASDLPLPTKIIGSSQVQDSVLGGAPSVPNALQDIGVSDPPQIANALSPSPTTAPEVAPVTESIHRPASVVESIQRNETPIAFKPKKKVTKKGKPCIIRLPRDTTKSYNGQSMPLSSSEVNKRLQDLENAGFDTRGFGFWKADPKIVNSDDHSQNRAEFWEAFHAELQPQAAKPSIFLPDKRRWDAYVDNLTEQKLRALGVSTGDDLAPPDMMRQGSSPLPALPASPPPLSSSATSQHMWQNTLPFSAPFSPLSMTNNTSIDALGSPISSVMMPGRPGHLSRQSTFGFGFNPTQNVAQMPPNFPPQRMSSAQALTRGGSPGMPPNLQRFSSNLSLPAESLMDRQITPRGQLPNVNNTGYFDQVVNRAASSTPQEQRQRPGTDSRSAAETTEQEAELLQQTPRGKQQDTSYQDLAYPTPRGHRHNISANLEREAEKENAQYYPGEYVNETESDEKDLASTDAGTSQNGKANSSSGQPQRRAQGHQAMPSTASNVSSKLNVEAKEFKFDPGKAHTRNSSVMSKNGFFPTTSSTFDKPLDPLRPFTDLATAHANKGSDPSHFNVDAPVFQPPVQATMSVPSGGFSFSAARPAIPTLSTPAKSEGTVSSLGTPASASRIFSEIDTSEIVKPARRSKAIPIVNPNVTDKDDSEEEQLEDEDGRPLGPAAKRGRRGGADGEQVPQFAFPTDFKPDGKESDEPRKIVEGSTKQALGELPRDLKHSLFDPDDEIESEKVKDDSDVPWHGIEEKSPLRDRSTQQLKPVKTDTNQSSSNRSPVKHSPPYPDGDNVSPSFKDINEVMEQLNNDNSDFGVEQSRKNKEEDVPEPLVTYIPAERSPKEDMAQMHVGKRGSQEEDKPTINGWLESQRKYSPGRSPVQKLNRLGDQPVSDWDDLVASDEEHKFSNRQQFFDGHVSSLIEKLLKKHLAPFEKSLTDVATTVKKTSRDRPSSRASAVAKTDDSDADDEDDEDVEDHPPRPRQSKQDRNVERIKHAVREAISSQQTHAGLDQIDQESRLRKAAEQRAEDLQRLLTLSEREIELFKEETGGSDERLRSLEQERDDFKRHHANVEDELRKKTIDFTTEIAALERSLDEYRSASTKWRDEIDSVKDSRESLTRMMETLQREADDHQRARDNAHSKLDKMQEELNTASENLSNERTIWQRKEQAYIRDTEVLQVRLEDQGQQREKLGAEVDRLKQHEQEVIKVEVALEEVRNSKYKLESKVSSLNEEIFEHQKLAMEHARAIKAAKDNTSTEVQRVRLVLEAEIEAAKKQAETMRFEYEKRLELSKAELDGVKKQNEYVRAEYEKRLELADEEIQSIKSQAENIRTDLATRLELAKGETSSVRADAEGVRARYERMLSEATQSHEQAAQRQKDEHNSRLEEERARLRQSLQDVTAQHERAMNNVVEDRKRSEVQFEEERARHQRSLGEASSRHEKALGIAKSDTKRFESELEEVRAKSQQAIDEANTRHKRALENALEDKLRAETHLNESLSLAQSKIEHLEDKTRHLEDKVSVAQSAAQAAAEAAKTRAIPAAAAAAAAPVAATSPKFEKISPQALRESIAVLQEQLQERESRIEQLESELADRTDESAKLGERDNEVGWLRELLTVRVDDISELCNTLMRDRFDRAKARDAAIRIRANLQMEQQEKERLIANSRDATPGSLPSVGARNASGGSVISDLQNFATPKAAQLAAAWGNWRSRARSGLESVSQTPSSAGLRSALNAGTPSKRGPVNEPVQDDELLDDEDEAGSVTASNFLSGLMTPPASNLRKTPTSASSMAVHPGSGLPGSGLPLPRAAGRRPSSSASARPASSGHARRPSNLSTSSYSNPSSPSKQRRASAKVDQPTTPPLMRKGDYDLDAELAGGGNEDLEEGYDEDAVETGGEEQRVWGEVR